MLRKHIKLLATEKKYRSVIKNFTKLMIISAIMFLGSFPYISKSTYTNENALHAGRLKFELSKTDGALASFNKI
jgi:hypothetical protein